MPTRDPRLRAPDGALNMIGQRLKQRRKALKMTQPDLIGRLSLATSGLWTPSRIDISRIERKAATRSITDTELVALAAVLDVDPSWLLVGDVTVKEGLREAVRDWEKRVMLDSQKGEGSMSIKD